MAHTAQMLLWIILTPFFKTHYISLASYISFVHLRFVPQIMCVESRIFEELSFIVLLTKPPSPDQYFSNAHLFQCLFCAPDSPSDFYEMCCREWVQIQQGGWFLWKLFPCQESSAVMKRILPVKPLSADHLHSNRLPRVRHSEQTSHMLHILGTKACAFIRSIKNRDSFQTVLRLSLRERKTRLAGCR